MSLGFMITNITSKFGILSRKAAIRIATNTGKTVVDKSNEVGRMLNKEEIEKIFSETVPKRCRPKIITTNEEAIDVFKRTGHSEDEINNFLNLPFAAAVIENGTKRFPIWLPFEKFDTLPKEIQAIMGPTIAHELEHALEQNNSIYYLCRRKLSGIKNFFEKLFDKNYKQKDFAREMGIHECEGDMQVEMLKCVNSQTGKFLCEPTIEEMDKYLKENINQSFTDILKSNFRKKYVSAENSGSEQIKRFNKMIYWFDMERPAYQVTGEVCRYAFRTPKDEKFIMEVVPLIYKKSIDIAKKERKTYLKNKILNRLKKPNIYTSDKDILKYASTSKEKQTLQELISGLTQEQKNKLIKVFYSLEGQPNAIQILKSFLSKTTIKGKNIYFDKLELFEGINLQLLSNRDFIEIARYANTKAINSEVIEKLFYKISHSKANSKSLRICAGKLRKAIQRKEKLM